MKKILVTLSLIVGLAVTQVAAAPLEGCSPAIQKEITKTAIDVGLAECLARSADIQDTKALREICKWADELAPVVENLLAARKEGLAKASKAGACGPSPGGK